MLGQLVCPSAHKHKFEFDFPTNSYTSAWTNCKCTLSGTRTDNRIKDINEILNRILAYYNTWY